VALLDLDLHLGDAALTLGVSSKYSVTDALEGVNRLDSDFLAAIMTRHSSGLAVLCAPDGVSSVYPDRNAVEKLVRVAREVFDYVVVDAGKLPTDVCQALFESATTVYLVTQVAIPELRNANRILAKHFSGARAARVEIVLNRYDDPMVDIDDASVTKALTRPPKWKIPSDPETARHAQNSAIPFAMTDSAIGRQVRSMARVAAGLAPLDQKKRRFGMFGA
jgi:pilus assembly protein CpaE